MKIHKYDDYDDYVDAQTEANVRKINLLWVNEKVIQQIQKLIPSANHILCHGTRNAAEQKFFKKYYPNANIIGTEISHTATQFTMTVQHDFHEIKEDWIGIFDIVYSNSFDHSYDPNKSLLCWKNQINKNGRLFIELIENEKSKRSDPLSLKMVEFEELCKNNSLEIIGKYKGSKFESTLIMIKIKD